jgi:hypothetical protein
MEADIQKRRSKLRRKTFRQNKKKLRRKQSLRKRKTSHRKASLNYEQTLLWGIGTPVNKDKHPVHAIVNNFPAPVSDDSKSLSDDESLSGVTEFDKDDYVTEEDPANKSSGEQESHHELQPANCDEEEKSELNRQSTTGTDIQQMRCTIFR